MGRLTVRRHQAQDQQGNHRDKTCGSREGENFACYTFKKDGKCNRKDCPYSHDPSTCIDYTRKGKETKGQEETSPQASASAKKVTVVKLSVSINEMTVHKDQENDGALLDSGASEVVRPYIYGWHRDIQSGRCRGRDVPLCLAGGVHKTGVMTGTGEVMIPRERGEVQGWILPMIRIVEELGGAVTWDVKEFRMRFPGGKVIKANARGDGLRYVNREDLRWIRTALVKSHFKGRPTSTRVKTHALNCPDEDRTEMYDSNGEVILTRDMIEASEEVQAWKDWEGQQHDQDEVWINKMACDHYLKDCVTCRVAKGGKRPHWRGAMKEMKLTLCADLTGPHYETPDLNFKYLLVVVAIDQHGRKLPFCRGLQTKRGQEVSIVVESIIKEVRALDPSVEFVRFHTDAGKEFLNADLEEVLGKYKIYQTHNGGHDPQANGLAERFIGIIKGRAGSYLVHAKMSMRHWYWACMQAAAVMRLKALDIKIAEGAPTFGDTVIVRRPLQEKKGNCFQEKGAVGTFLHWSSVVPMGAWVILTKEDGQSKIELCSLPANWKRVAERRWKMARYPTSNLVVWVDQDGEVFSDQPEEAAS